MFKIQRTQTNAHTHASTRARTHARTHTHTHTESYIKAIGLKKGFLKRGRFDRFENTDFTEHLKDHLELSKAALTNRLIRVFLPTPLWALCKQARVHNTFYLVNSICCPIRFQPKQRKRFLPYLLSRKIMITSRSKGGEQLHIVSSVPALYCRLVYCFFGGLMSASVHLYWLVYCFLAG